ncbi:helix-turn-helix domain-containing protein [Microbacterium sp. Leaf179]|uniref:helix-turn-helix domain-containing protein n=1 Tax=Microbacterium sp. Leaf179 TaxID=1736288 RepID=UPI0022865088|nr:XRE family transcriptional regulator [Microbacterium sp. Leaf179]
MKGQRRARGWSMRELARRAGVSQPFVSKLESAQLVPSIATLYALADALGVSPSTLLPPTGGPDAADGDGLHLPLVDGDGPEHATLVAGGSGKTLQAYEFRLSRGEGDTAYFRHGGEEFVYVVAGGIRCEREGLDDLELVAGASFSIDPTVPHRWRATTDAVTFLLVCSEIEH